MKRELIIQVCDVCKTERTNAGIETHQLILDGRGATFESCARCWRDAESHLLTVMASGRHMAPRKATRPARRQTRTMIAATTTRGWSFSEHAIDRMSKREITVALVMEIIQRPETIFPYPNSDSVVIHQIGPHRVALDTKAQIIVTVMKRDDIDSLAVGDALGGV